MTEFISRAYGSKEWGVIIKTDNEDHYKCAELFARKLIDHGKTHPMTNADRIRAMSDEELAEFMAERYDREHTARILGELIGRGYAPDQTMRRALHEKVRLQWFDWLKQPVKDGA